MDVCHNCGSQDHWYRECPLNTRAHSHAEHLARIDALVTRWQNGEISIEHKRRGISSENILWHGVSCPARLTYP